MTMIEHTSAYLTSLESDIEQTKAKMKAVEKVAPILYTLPDGLKITYSYFANTTDNLDISFSWRHETELSIDEKETRIIEALHNLGFAPFVQPYDYYNGEVAYAVETFNRLPYHGLNLRFSFTLATVTPDKLPHYNITITKQTVERVSYQFTCSKS